MADDVLHSEAQIELLLERLIFKQQRLLANGFFDNDADFIIDDGLGEIIEHAHFRGFDSAFDGAVAGDDNHDDVRVAAAHIAQKIGRLNPRHIDVRQQQFDRIGFHDRQRIVG